MGQLAVQEAKEGVLVSGLLVRKDFNHQIMSAADLNVYTQITTSVIAQRQSVPFHQPFPVLKSSLEQMYDLVEEGTEEDNATLKVILIALIFLKIIEAYFFVVLGA